MSWDNNVYYNPEKSGLEQIGQIDWTEPDYSFDMTVVWKDADNKLYWAFDSGCSCPAPFEDDDLHTLSTGSITALKNHLRAMLDERKGSTWGRPATLADVTELLAKVKKAVAK
jgi:hypothetical protein